MKKICLALFVFYSFNSFAQKDNSNAIKLFIDLPGEDISVLNSQQKTRLLLKITQLVNKTGVAEVGYSNFLVYPNFDVLDVQYSEAGIQKVYMAKCQLSLFISRRSYDRSAGSKMSAVYASSSFDITGTGSKKEEAINNAVNNISVDNEKMIDFITKAKGTIIEYFNKNCTQIIKEAEQATKLQDYAKAISLYFSIPSSAAACYDEAKGKSIGVFKSYQENDCQRKYVQLKAVLASVRNINDSTQVKRYNEAINLLSDIDPNTSCFEEASKLLNSVEARFTEEQKKQWQFVMLKQKNANAYQDEIFKTMSNISTNYRPAGSPGNIYINTDK